MDTNTVIFIVIVISVLGYALYRHLIFNKEEGNKIYVPEIVTFSEFPELDTILTLINEVRISLGIHKLLVCDKINQQAKKRCLEMIKAEKLSHTGVADEFKFLLDAGADSVGENIAYGFFSGTAVTAAWINSEGHYANIINQKYDYCGIYYVIDHKGRKWHCMLLVNEEQENEEIKPSRM